MSPNGNSVTSARRACAVARPTRPSARSPRAMCGWSGHRSWTNMTPGSSISEIPHRRTSDRVARIAAVGDLHCGEDDRGAFRDHLTRVNDDADILILCGDLTRRGLPAEFRTVVGELADVKTPIAAVLGNHDHERSEERRVGKECRSRWPPHHRSTTATASKRPAQLPQT